MEIVVVLVIAALIGAGLYIACENSKDLGDDDD